MAMLCHKAKSIVTAGVIEGSNVNAAEAMVSMIANARHFEMQMKLSAVLMKMHNAPINCSRLAKYSKELL